MIAEGKQAGDVTALDQAVPRGHGHNGVEIGQRDVAHMGGGHAVKALLHAVGEQAGDPQHLRARIAQRLNRSFKFDPVAKKVVGDEVAQRLLKGSEGTPRKGWEEFYRV